MFSSKVNVSLEGPPPLPKLAHVDAVPLHPAVNLHPLFSEHAPHGRDVSAMLHEQRPQFLLRGRDRTRHGRLRHAGGTLVRNIEKAGGLVTRDQELLIGVVAP